MGILSIVEDKVRVTLRPTVSRPVRLGVRHPSGTRDQFFFLLEIFFRQLRACYFVAPSLTRRPICNLLLLLVLASQFLRLPQPGGPGHRIYIPRKVAQIYPWALGSLSVASSDSQSYGGSILSRLHTGH
jgi:hypothetical protein